MKSLQRKSVDTSQQSKRKRRFAMHHLKTILIVLVIAVLLSFVRLAFGQAVFGNITGTVTDPSGAAVANAELMITDLERGISYSVKTNSVGNYTETHLLAG